MSNAGAVDPKKAARSALPAVWIPAAIDGVLLLIAGYLLPDGSSFSEKFLLFTGILLLATALGSALRRANLIAASPYRAVGELDWAGLSAARMVGIGILLFGVPMALIFLGLQLSGFLGGAPVETLGEGLGILLGNIVVWSLGGALFGLTMGGIARLGCRIGGDKRKIAAQDGLSQRGLLYRVTWGMGLGAWLSLPFYAFTGWAVVAALFGFVGAFAGLAVLPALSGDIGGDWRQRAKLALTPGWAQYRGVLAGLSRTGKLATRFFGFGLPNVFMLAGAFAPLYLAVDGFADATSWPILAGAAVVLAVTFAAIQRPE